MAKRDEVIALIQSGLTRHAAEQLGTGVGLLGAACCADILKGDDWKRGLIDKAAIFADSLEAISFCNVWPI